MMTTNDSDEYAHFRTIDAVAAIRARSAMYIGEPDRPAVANVLLQECLCIPLDNALSGCTTEIRITLSADGSVEIWDNGPALPLLRDNGLPVIQTLLTQIHACRAAKRHPHKNLCRIGIVVTDALSQWLHVDCGVDGRHWRQQYEKGIPTGPFSDVGAADGTWEQITFLPDPTVFRHPRVDIPAFRNWFAEQQFPLPHCRITIRDAAAGERIQLT